MCAKEEWAFTDKSGRIAETIQPGDNGIIYLRGEGGGEPSAVGGSVDFLGMRFRATGCSMFDQLFPVRMPIRVNHVLKEPVPFRPLVQSINFIRHKSNWGCYLQGRAAIELGEKDFTVLVEAINERVRDSG